ncbi:hypothetical protein [Janibacter cremeus]|uniref:Uncharacterized protein n=1 Tax=Janibacter cremeus TaxID=1285192 RepID=A0A852VU33_9MICO|nr:hypothetical protein [Janibacter cremeus]NYF98183.1 hypothetical protein [Janibacter cremeus]
MTSSLPSLSNASGRPTTLIVGLVLAVLALLLCVGGAGFLFLEVQDVTDEPVHEGSHTIQLEAGESTAVWSSHAQATCSVAGPDGPVSDSGTASQTVTFGGQELQRIFAIDAGSAGSYAISCSAPFIVADSLNMGAFVPVALGSGLCCFSVFVIIVGLVLWLSKRKGGTAAPIRE